jgi:hypothetical protein
MRIGSFTVILALIGSASGGCAMTDSATEGSQSAEVTEKPELSAFVLTVNSDENSVTVASSSGSNTCAAGPCNFAYIAGTALTIRTANRNVPDCEQFTEWVGACAGQTSVCSIVINSNLSTSAEFGPYHPCTPQ